MQNQQEGARSARLMDTPEASKYSGLPQKTLETWRSRGGGPKYVKLGRSVRYTVEHLDEFIAKGTRSSTSDTGAA